ncbi:MAG TPA: hypothetical protein VFV83_11030 [Chthoniobacteraceae bacterium]|nr:hypothetical protein [Chthoniobacteraceae bacterium]
MIHVSKSSRRVDNPGSLKRWEKRSKRILPCLHGCIQHGEHVAERVCGDGLKGGAPAQIEKRKATPDTAVEIAIPNP